MAIIHFGKFINTNHMDKLKGKALNHFNYKVKSQIIS